MATGIETQFYRTSDMALATYLKFLGHDSQKVDWEGRTCYWHFRETESLLGAVTTFIEGQASIEPREYNRIFNKTKREFYDSDPGEQDPNRR